MKNKIYGRMVGSTGEMVLLFESDGCSSNNSANKADPNVIVRLVIGNARRSIQMLQERNIEGYIVFESDPRHYEFSPDSYFDYPWSSTVWQRLDAGVKRGATRAGVVSSCCCMAQCKAGSTNCAIPNTGNLVASRLRKMAGPGRPSQAMRKTVR